MQDLSKYKNDGVLFDGHYRLIKLLSTEGGTADVWLAENYESIDTKLSEDNDDVIRVDGTGVLVAIKIYRPKNILDVDGEQSFRSEFKTIFNCHHANLIPTTDYSICDGMPYLVMPFCDNGSVESLIGKLNDEDDVWKLMADVSSGLGYLHSLEPPIIHQDIKPANILIDTNKNYCVTDFGISVKSGVEDDRYFENESSGTAIYMPPERYNEEYKPNTSSDIWAFGATIYEVLTGDVPFGNDGGAAQLAGAQIPAIKNKNISKRIKNIIYACLDADPKKRPTAKYIEEYSKRKGKKNHVAILVASIAIICIMVSTMIVWNTRTKKIEPFLVYKNSGDSIITLQKQETQAVKFINYELTNSRLNKAKVKYIKAVREKTENKLAKDSINKRIVSIQNLFMDLKTYKGICDTLDIAIHDNLPIQEEVYSERKKKFSEKLKTKINNL